MAATTTEIVAPEAESQPVSISESQFDNGPSNENNE